MRPKHELGPEHSVGTACVSSIISLTAVGKSVMERGVSKQNRQDVNPKVRATAVNFKHMD